MSRHSNPKNRLPAAVSAALIEMGRNIKVARLSRRWSRADLAEKAGISSLTLMRIERGVPGVAAGLYAAAIWALGMERDLSDVGNPERDLEGRRLAELRLGERARSVSGTDNDF